MRGPWGRTGSTDTIITIAVACGARGGRTGSTDTIITIAVACGARGIAPGLQLKLAKSTRLPGSLPVFYHFYPSTRFFKFLPVLGIPISKKKIKKKKTVFFVCFYP